MSVIAEINSNSIGGRELSRKKNGTYFLMKEIWRISSTYPRNPSDPAHERSCAVIPVLAIGDENREAIVEGC